MLLVTGMWLAGAGVLALAFECVGAAVTLCTVGALLINYAS
jgi:hypothetical protein